MRRHLLQSGICAQRLTASGMKSLDSFDFTLAAQRVLNALRHLIGNHVLTEQ